MKRKILVLCLVCICFTGPKVLAQKVITSVFYEPYKEVPHLLPQFPIMFYNEEFRAFKDLPFVFLFNDIVSEIIDVYGPGYINAADVTNYPTMEIATFYPFYTDELIDKSYLTGSAEHQSKLYFWMDTVDGEQIFKIEWKNLGFRNCTANDSLNMQAWFFERGNKVQFRFGKSNLTDPGMLNIEDTTYIGFEVSTANSYYYGTFDGDSNRLNYKDMYAWGNVIGIPKEGTVIEIKANATFVNTNAKKIDKGIILVQSDEKIKLKHTEQDVEIHNLSLYNSNGELLIKSSSNEMNVTTLTAGMYILKVQTNKGVYTQKYLK
jgi:hypothetical protein